MRLYHYWRSSSSWRVRIALAYKGIHCEYVPVHLLTGESESPEHHARNPMGYVPVLEISPTTRLTESIAILEWLEETHPASPLLPPIDEPLLRARVRQLCEIINASIQPLQNLSVLEKVSADSEKQKEWAQHWIREGLKAYEFFAKQTAGRYSVGDELTLADVCLVPQAYAANRQGVDLAREFPLLHRAVEALAKLPCVEASHPDRFKPKLA